MVELLLPKQTARVRFPSSAPYRKRPLTSENNQANQSFRSGTVPNALSSKALKNVQLTAFSTFADDNGTRPDEPCTAADKRESSSLAAHSATPAGAAYPMAAHPARICSAAATSANTGDARTTTPGAHRRSPAPRRGTRGRRTAHHGRRVVSWRPRCPTGPRCPRVPPHRHRHTQLPTWVNPRFHR